MSDLIERQAAIDALEKHEKSKGHNYTFFVDVVSECAEIIRDVPSAQPDLSEYSNKLWRNAYERGKREAQPDIIRCKDCKYQEKFFHEDKRRKEGGYYIFGCELSSEYSHVCLDEDFCSRAERREE